MERSENEVAPCYTPPGWEPALIPLFSINPGDDLIITPCIRAAKDKLGDVRINIFSKELWRFPGTNETLDWTIDYLEDNNISSTIAETTTYLSQKKSEIRIKSNLFDGTAQANSSQEFAGWALLHEIVHVFLRVYMDKYNLVHFDQVSHHEIMIKNLITSMAATLQNAYGISEIDAKHLAIQGCDDVLKTRVAALYSWNVEWANFIQIQYNIDVAQAANTLQAYKTGAKGTTCF